MKYGTTFAGMLRLARGFAGSGRIRHVPVGGQESKDPVPRTGHGDGISIRLNLETAGVVVFRLDI